MNWQRVSHFTTKSLKGSLKWLMRVVLLLTILLTLGLSYLWLKHDELLSLARTRIEQELSRLSSQQVSVGTLRVTLTPLPALFAKDFTVKNSVGCPQLRAESIILYPSLSKALHGNLGFKKIRLIAVASTLTLDQDQMYLQTGIVRCTLDQAPHAIQPPVPSAVPKAAKPFEFEIESLSLERSALRVHKARADTTNATLLSLKELQLGLYSSSDTHRLSALRAQGELQGNALELQAPALTYTHSAATLELESLEIHSLGQNILLSGNLGVTSGALALRASSTAPELQRLKPILSQLLGIEKIAGALDARVALNRLDHSSALEFSGDLNVTNFSLQDTARSLELLQTGSAAFTGRAWSPTSLSMQAALKLAAGRAGWQKNTVHVEKAQLELQYSREGQDSSLQATGDIGLTSSDLNVPKLQTAKLSLGKFKLQLSPQKTQLSAQLDASSVRMSIADAQYQSASIAGPIELKNGPNLLEWTGSYSFKQFGYQTEGVRLSSVDAVLKDFTLRNDKKGLVIAGTTDASSLQMQTKGVHVSRVSRVLAPLKVRVPATGGYSVDGPVNVENLDAKIAEKYALNLTGTVSMALATGKQEFSTQRLQVLSAGQNAELKAVLKLNPQRLVLSGVAVDFLPGELESQAFVEWQRAAQPFAAEVTLRNVAIEKLMALLTQQPGDSYSGIIGTGQAKFQGNFRQPLETLTGNGGVEIEQRLLRKFNFTEALLRAVSKVLPITTLESIAGKKPQTDRSRAQFSIKDQILFLKALQLQQPNFSVVGSAELAFSGALKGSVEAIFLRSQLRGLSLGIGVLDRILSTTGKIAIPLTVGGMIQAPTVEVDLRRLPSALPGVSLIEEGVSQGKRGLDLLLRPFGGKKPVASPAPL
jgi:hypothetical protein